MCSPFSLIRDFLRAYHVLGWCPFLPTPCYAHPCLHMSWLILDKRRWTLVNVHFHVFIHIFAGGGIRQACIECQLRAGWGPPSIPKAGHGQQGTCWRRGGSKTRLGKWGASQEKTLVKEQLRVEQSWTTHICETTRS